MRRYFGILCWAIYCLLLLEVASRFFLFVVKQTPLASPQEVFTAYYPEVKPVARLLPDAPDAAFDIVLLGGSVMSFQAPQLEAYLAGLQTERYPKGVRIHNLAVSSHTSLDSYYKFKWLADKHFDLVVIYHGINEVRANNIPKEAFREDYSHYGWYRETNLIERHRELKWLAFPYVMHLSALKGLEKLANTWAGCFLPSLKLVPTHQPRIEWIRFGSDIKTASCYEKKLLKIVRIAQTKKLPVLLMSFASYLPENYSRQAFEDGKLDYASGVGMPAEIWGDPVHVVAGIHAHNRVVGELARRCTGVGFLDMDALIPAKGEYFTDVCHFSESGGKLFVRTLGEWISEFLMSKDPLQPR